MTPKLLFSLPKSANWQKYSPSKQISVCGSIYIKSLHKGHDLWSQYFSYKAL